MRAIASGPRSANRGTLRRYQRTRFGSGTRELYQSSHLIARTSHRLLKLFRSLWGTRSHSDIARFRSSRDPDGRVAPRRIARHALGDGHDDEILDRAPQRPRAELRIVPELREARARARRHLEAQVARDEAGAPAELVELELDDLLERGRRERPERDDRVDAAEELRPEEAAD